MGLLSPGEFFITVDHFSLWRRHLAWAKDDGGDLRTHMTQRFASNMVFMSLLLGAEIQTLFNSSQITTQMRMHMRNCDYTEITFWIGVVIFMSVFLTLFTILSTFTAWGMVSAVSDSNSHCLLRSSIGQYVTQLPSRFIVAALNSFLLWVIMYLFVLLPGPIGKVVFVVVAFLFFHIVVVYSAFGRLIIHTGAMGQKRILEPEFERALLPSGLHTSLLIKATDQQRKNTQAIAQYRSSLFNKRAKPLQKVHSTRKKTTRTRMSTADSLLSHERKMIHQSANALSNSKISSEELLSSREITVTPSHQDLESGNSVSSLESASEDVPKTSPNFPRASVLNKPDMTLKSIRLVVDKTLSSEEKDAVVEGHRNLPNKGRQSKFTTWNARRRRARRRSGAKSMIKEWEEDNFCRSYYNAPPPAALVDDDAAIGGGGVKWNDVGGTRLPRPSVLNRTNLRFASIKRVAEEADGAGMLLPADFDSESSIEDSTEERGSDGHQDSPQKRRTSSIASILAWPITSLLGSISEEHSRRRFSDISDEMGGEDPDEGKQTHEDQEHLHDDSNEKELLLPADGLQHANYSSGVQISEGSSQNKLAQSQDTAEEPTESGAAETKQLKETMDVGKATTTDGSTVPVAGTSLNMAAKESADPDKAEGGRAIKDHANEKPGLHVHFDA